MCMKFFKAGQNPRVLSFLGARTKTRMSLGGKVDHELHKLMSKKGVTAAPARVRFGTRSWRCWFGGQSPHTESLPSCEGERVREGGGERGKGRGGEREAREERRGGRGKPKQDSVKGICTFDFWRVFRLEQRLLDCLLHRIPI